MLSRTTTQHGGPLTTAEDKTRLYELVLDNGCPVRLTDAWFSAEIMRKMFFIYVLDIHDSARPEDRGYFRRSREGRLKGKTLEQAVADRESQLPALRHALTPLRTHLSRFPYLGGGAPNYADYIAFGLFLWVASVSTLPMLAHDDTLRSWVDRGFDLYGGLRRSTAE